MRLQSHIWVKAYMRRVQSAGGTGVLVRRGEASAGAIYIRVNLLNGNSLLFCPAPAIFSQDNPDRRWYLELGSIPLSDQEIDDYIRSQISFDSDLWLIEVEDRGGEHYLGEELIEVEL